MSARRSRERAIQLHLGAVSGGPTGELRFSIVARAAGSFVEVFAHDPSDDGIGIVVALDADGYAELKSMLDDIDDEIRGRRFVLSR